MYCVGLTGSVASGKSTLSSFFKTQGIIIISADDIAKELTAANQPALRAIKNHFGPSIITPAGALNRAALREIIFNDPQQRLWLEQLLHPLIRDAIQMQANKADSPYCIIEIPLLTNKLDYPYLNRILLVLATPSQKIERLVERDNIKQELALNMLATQQDDLERKKIADDVLINDGTLTELRKKMEALHHLYLSLSKLSRVVQR